MWIAREKNGELLLYAERPIHNFHTYENTYDLNYINARGFCCGLYIGKLDNSLFPEVTFENSPQEVELKLKQNES